MKKLLTVLTVLALVKSGSSQSIGMGTKTPDPSAAVDISDSKKGLLIPRVALLSVADNTSIPLPANSLLVYNTNNALADGAGYYYNSGTAMAPVWSKLATSANSFSLPYVNSVSNGNPAFSITNTNANAGSAAIAAAGTYGIGLKAISSSGIGVYASSSTGDALQVNGKLKISGSPQLPATGKVLTSDGLGYATWQTPAASNNIAFSATGVAGGGSQIMAPNVYSKIPFLTEKYDLGSNYNIYTVSPHSTFTAPVNGIYHFESVISYSGLDVKTPGLYMNVLYAAGGENTVAANSFLSDNGNAAQIAISMDLKLSVGDKVFMLTKHSSASNKSLNTTDFQSSFSGRLEIKL